jgi:predicted permease
VSDASVWVPLQEDPNVNDGWYLTGIGRLKPGVSFTQARDDLLNVHRGMVEEQSANDITSPVVNSLRDRYLGEFRLGSSVLLGAVGIILLIACGNIAGLMLARSMARSREISLRVALGASRRRIVSQLLTESVFLAFLGAVAGTALGFWGSSVLVGRMAEDIPQWITFDLDWRFFSFTLLVTVGAAIAFGLAPALQAAGTDTRGVLQSAGTRTSASVGKRRSMSVLVASEVALALMLLIVAGLSVRDVRRLQRTDPGYRAEKVLTYRLSLPSVKYENREQRLAFFEHHLERLRGLPGVLSAAGANSLPLSGHWGRFFEVEGAPERGPDDPNPVVLNRIVSPGYLATMGVTLRAGRPFNAFDGRELGNRAVIVNETFVRLFFEDGIDPLGKRIKPGGDTPWMTVVGITQDVKHYGVDQEMRPGVYQPLRQAPRGSMQIAVRTAADPTGVVSAVRNELRAADPDLPLYNVMTMRERFDESLWIHRASSTLIALFSTVALALALAGIYGVISYGVGQRTHEIGIRIALGARKTQVLHQVMRQGMSMVGFGIVAGLGAAYASARVLSSLFVEVSATDPITYGAVTLFLLAVAAVANFIPARRAAGLDPMETLRSE